MFKIINIGMNHETAPVELRECLAAEPDNTVKALACMRDLECVREGLFLSTCNRVEALFTTEDAGEAKKSVISLMSGLGNMPEEKFSSSLYTFEDRDAVRHIFRVASSLDSMVVGEPQILGQIKEAYRAPMLLKLWYPPSQKLAPTKVKINMQKHIIDIKAARRPRQPTTSLS